jgi:predicted RNA-binding protein Jag
MKSIVEEASSIAKAIENGWIRAGKPQEFTVRIFEEPEKNFLGFSKKPAKVGLFYKEIPSMQPGIRKDVRKQQQHPQAPRVVSEKKVQQQKPLQTQQVSQAPKQSAPLQQQKTAELPKQPKWTPQLIDGSKDWIQTMLNTIEKDSTQFTIEQRQYFLTIRFAHPLLSDSRKEQLLFKSWSHLLLQALRHRFKRGLRGYKIIITSAAA